MQNVNEFEWTDERAIEFARVCSQGAYGEYAGCKKIDQKLERFKQLTLEEIKIQDLPKTCVLCKSEFYGFGNNPEPLADEGRCCDSCNTDVIMKRLEILSNART